MKFWALFVVHRVPKFEMLNLTDIIIYWSQQVAVYGFDLGIQSETLQVHVLIIPQSLDTYPCRILVDYSVGIIPRN